MPDSSRFDQAKFKWVQVALAHQHDIFQRHATAKARIPHPGRTGKREAAEIA